MLTNRRPVSQAGSAQLNSLYSISAAQELSNVRKNRLMSVSGGLARFARSLRTIDIAHASSEAAAPFTAIAAMMRADLKMRAMIHGTKKSAQMQSGNAACFQRYRDASSGVPSENGLRYGMTSGRITVRPPASRAGPSPPVTQALRFFASTRRLCIILNFPCTDAGFLKGAPCYRTISGAQFAPL